MKLKFKKTSIVILCVITIFIISLFSNTTLTLFFPKKIWQHKVNSIEKLKNCNYTGVELDAVYLANKNVFDVYHPPEKSQNLLLKNYLKNLPENVKCIWLDFKNLNEDNSKNALSLLKKLTKEKRFDQKNIIIESEQLKALSYFQKNGFKTSYYFPQDLSKLKDKELELELLIIKKQLLENKPTYISSKYVDYNLLKKHFPNEKKLFWFNVYGDNNQLKVRLLLYKILFDDNVDALLIP